MSDSVSTRRVYLYGDTVDVTIQGARVVNADTDVLWLLVGDTNTVMLDLRSAGVTVTTPAPVNEWYPRRPVPGDVWVDRNSVSWFAADNDPGVALVSTNGDWRNDPDEVLAKFGPMTIQHWPVNTCGSHPAGV